jgi:hypothetical protein
MSEIQVGQINSTDGSTAITTGADGYVSFAKTQIGGRRNLIINGAMQVAQRGTETTGISSGASYYTADRWNFTTGSGGTWTASQSTTAPEGFSNSFKLECTTANASLSAGSLTGLQHAIEGQNLQHLKYGTANAETITMSFWVRSAKTGTYIAEIYGVDNARQISKAYTIDSADTWEFKTVTFEGDTIGSLDNDNNVSFWCVFWLVAGTDFTSGTLSTDWTANTNANRVVGQVNLADTVGNTFYITGVQLEVGTVATPFEHRSYGEELALCQRYYVKITSSASNDSFGIGVNEDTTRCFTHHAFPVPMRADPTALETTGTATDYEIRIPGTTVTCSVVPEFVRASEYGSLIRFIVSSGLTQGQGGQNRAANGNAFLAWSAEL